MKIQSREAPDQGRGDAPRSDHPGSRSGNGAAEARVFARAKHAGQYDKLGVPMIHHLDDVARRVAGETATVICIAWLHDSVEAAGATLSEIETLFGRDVRDGVDAMTRRDGETYFGEYLPRLLKNPDAILVKIADASHNLGKAHLLARSDPRQAASLEKRYRRALGSLSAFVAAPERLVFDQDEWRRLSG